MRHIGQGGLGRPEHLVQHVAPVLDGNEPWSDAARVRLPGGTRAALRNCSGDARLTCRNRCDPLHSKASMAEAAKKNPARLLANILLAPYLVAFPN